MLDNKMEESESKKHFVDSFGASDFEIKEEIKEESQQKPENPLECDECGITVPTVYFMTLHKKVHTGERPHKCNFCDKAYARKTHLTRHELSHTGGNLEFREIVYFMTLLAPSREY